MGSADSEPLTRMTAATPEPHASVAEQFSPRSLPYRYFPLSCNSLQEATDTEHQLLFIQVFPDSVSRGLLSCNIMLSYYH